ncbi:hypothetical protein E2N92_09530 [Methanofollis formosanus]|uniref:DNA repair protein n=1 Tax=Methanofollis formosanus TaxID=299308 RepID=A0A8G1A1G7_9EURY|nr:hypothetical protein [Methanofollis formosanus]QYZ79654.1 hypothetical protein E2N92_09530 [Methanofollis formosanus]
MVRCAECKGRLLCGLPRCPIMSRFHAQVTTAARGTSYMGTAPSVFVGSYGYPEVSAGPLMTTDADAPPTWVAQGLSIEDIVGIRARTIRGSAPTPSVSGQIQEIALSSSPLDVEAAFERPVRFDLRFDGTVTPVGLSGSIRHLDVIDNAKVSRVVDRITSDDDLPATEACENLGSEGVDVYQIAQLMSAGLLGKRRRVVPTKWAITAVDDTVGSGLKKAVFRFAPLEEVEFFAATLYGNTMAVILVPGDWKFEMIEVWGRRSLWAGEEETVICDLEGRKQGRYSPIGGAYYAARLAVAEYLTKKQRSARAIVVRHVNSEYWAPLGSWVIREATRGAMQGTPARCTDLRDAAVRMDTALGYSHWRERSRLLPELASQRTLFEF